MERVIAFIDGFNMYHSLANRKVGHLKWLNYWELANAFTQKKTQKLEAVYYFSAIVPWDTQKADRHKNYIKALQWAGVEVILGKFKRVTKECRADCRKKYVTYEEKETDVNIAVHIARLAMEDRFDTALVFSGDSDMIPAVKLVREIAPHKHIKAVIPYARSAEDMKKTCDSNAKIKQAHLERNQFPDPVVVNAEKNVVIQKPQEWQLEGIFPARS